MALSLESQFLLDILRASGRENQELPVPKASDQLNSDRLLAAAHFHRVVPLAYKTISRLDHGNFPASLLEPFRQNMTATTFRSLQLTAEMLRLLDLLEAEKIPTVAFKGPVLSLQAYGDPFTRQFDDIDLLVPSKDFDRALSFLGSQGYTEDGEAAHACNLSHAGRRTAVDLHRWISGPAGFSGSKSLVIDSDSLFSAAGYTIFQEHKIRAFQTEDLLMLLCVHGAKHAWRRWIWLFDVGAFVETNASVDWERLVRRSHEFGTSEPVYLSLRLTETVCGRRLPPEALKSFRVRPAIEQLVSTLTSTILQDPNPLRSDLRRYLLPFQTMPKFRERWAYYFRLQRKRLSPTSADRELVRLPRYLRFLYFFIRPLRLLYEYGPNVAGYTFLRIRRRISRDE